MAERASVTQGLYVAPEGTPGDGGEDFRILNSIDIEPGAKFEMQRFRPVGTKLETIIIPGKEWTECSVQGLAEYSELQYLFSGIYGPNQMTQPDVSDGTAQTWKYILSARQPDTVQTYGFIKGDDNFAESYSYGLFTEVGLELSREGIKIDGSMIAHELETGAEIPHAPTSIEETPLLPKEVSVYLSDTYGSLSSSKLTRAFMVKQTIGDRFNPVWVLDADEPSFVTHVELAPKFEFEVTVEANDEGMGMLENMREGDTLYMAIEAISPQLAGASTVPFSYNCTAATKIADIDKFEDHEGVYAVKYTLAAVADSEEDLTVETTLVNQATEL